MPEQSPINQELIKLINIIKDNKNNNSSSAKEKREILYKKTPSMFKKGLIELLRKPLRDLLKLIIEHHTIEELIMFEEMLNNELACMHKKEGGNDE